MKFIIYEINLFSYDQYAYVSDGRSNIDKIGPCPICNMGETITDYCEQNDITKVKVIGNKDYAENTVVRDIHQCVFRKYSNFDIDVEVIDK